jgi:hypothetical protein
VPSSLDVSQPPSLLFKNALGCDTELRRPLYSGRRKWCRSKSAFLDLRATTNARLKQRQRIYLILFEFILVFMSLVTLSYQPDIFHETP